MKGSGLSFVYCILFNALIILSPASFRFVDRVFNLLGNWNPIIFMNMHRIVFSRIWKGNTYKRTKQNMSKYMRYTPIPPLPSSGWLPHYRWR